MEKVLLALWLASVEYGVSYKTLYAIAKVESSLNPYAVNIGGKSYFPGSKEEALKLIKGKRNYDLGLMQINSYWVRKYKLNPKWLFDPYYNAKFGAYVLSYCISLHGNSWKAIDCYYRGEKRAKDYSVYSMKVCSVIYGRERC